MLILFNKYINTIIYIFIYTLLLHGLAVALHASDVWIPNGWWCPLVAGGASLVAGGASLVAGGASWHPRPHIAARHPGRGTHPLPSAAALAVEIQVSKE